MSERFLNLRNALIVLALNQEHRATRDLFVRQTILDTAAWGLKDMKDGEGVFFTSMGRDDGPTRAYFSFKESELRAALGPDRSEEFFKTFELSPEGFLRLFGSPFAGLGATRETLLLRRNRRVRLPLDEKIDPQANGLWIAALAQTAVELKRDDERLAAERAARVLLARAGHAVPGLALGLLRLNEATGSAEWLDAANRTHLDRLWPGL